LRYFSSHGPATLKDYVWWSGLKASDAKIGIDRASPKLKKEVIEDKTHYMPTSKPKPSNESTFLLPAYDEYVISYRDRSAILSNPKVKENLKSGKTWFAHSNGVFLPTIVIDGEVVGTWKRKPDKKRIAIELIPFVKFTKGQIRDIKEAAKKYGDFLEQEAFLRI